MELDIAILMGISLLFFGWILIAVHGCTGMKSKLAMQLNNAKPHDLKSSLPYNPTTEWLIFRRNYGGHIILESLKE